MQGGTTPISSLWFWHPRRNKGYSGVESESKVLGYLGPEGLKFVEGEDVIQPFSCFDSLVNRRPFLISIDTSMVFELQNSSRVKLPLMKS